PPAGRGAAVRACVRAHRAEAGRSGAPAGMARGARLPALCGGAGRDRLGGHPPVPGAAMSGLSRPRRLSWIASPFLAWGLHFFVVYSLQALVCGRGWSPASAGWASGSPTVAAFAPVGWCGLRARRMVAAAGGDAGRRLTARMVAMLCGLALVPMGFTVLPAVLLHPSG